MIMAPNCKHIFSFFFFYYFFRVGLTVLAVYIFRLLWKSGVICSYLYTNLRHFFVVYVCMGLCICGCVGMPIHICMEGMFNATLGYTSLSFMMKSQTRKWNTWINRSGYFHVMDINDVLVIELFFFNKQRNWGKFSCSSSFNSVHDDMEFSSNT